MRTDDDTFRPLFYIIYLLSLQIQDVPSQGEIMIYALMHNSSTYSLPNGANDNSLVLGSPHLNDQTLVNYTALLQYIIPLHIFERKPNHVGISLSGWPGYTVVW